MTHDPITIRNFICHNNRCGKTFREDGDQLIGSIRCPHCGSPNIDHNEHVHNGFNKTETSSTVPKRFIVKVYGTIKNFHPLYFLDNNDGSETKPVGTITKEGLTVLEEKHLLEEIPGTEIIEVYFRHKWLLTDIKTSRYYELKINL